MKSNPYVLPKNFMDLLLDVVCVVDRNSYFLYVSAASERVFGYKPDEMIGRPVIEFVHPEDHSKTLDTIDEILKGKQKAHFENRYIRKDGEVVHIMWSARWSDEDQVRVAIARDITEKKQSESRQRAVYTISEAAHKFSNLSSLLKHIHTVIKELLPAENFAVALCDTGKGYISFPYYSDQYNNSPSNGANGAYTLSSHIIDRGTAILLTPSTAESFFHRTNIHLSKNTLNWLGVPLKSGTGIIGAIVIHSYSDLECYTQQDMKLLEFVSEQVASAVELRKTFTNLEYMARYDQLTGLANRILFHDRFKYSIANARRNSSRVALLYLDLDEFKEVNDTFGHSTGDKVLSEVAKRLINCIRESDTVGRLGGDEFVVLLNNIKDYYSAQIVAEKIISNLNKPYEVDGMELNLNTSIGISVYPENGTDYESLIKFADNAMYDHKREKTSEKLKHG